MFPAVSFRIPTAWRVQGRIEDVADILSKPEEFPRWWGEVYLSVTTTKPGDAQGIGQTVAVHSKGWLPYRLNWQGTLVENHMVDCPAWPIRGQRADMLVIAARSGK